MSSGAPAVGVAAFDFDGTLVGRDSFLPFLARVKGRQALARSVVVAGPTVLRGNRDITKAAVLAHLLRGSSFEQVADVGETYGRLLATRVRPAMAERLAWHRQQGHRLVMVSASLEVYLAPAGRILGFDTVLATQLEVDADGRLTGRLLGANVRRGEKVDRLRRWLASEIGDHRYELWAYGDSRGDTELLAMADHPTWV